MLQKTKPIRTFITNRTHEIISNTIKVTNETTGLEAALKDSEIIAIDTEFSDLHPLYANLLLIGIFDGTNSWIIDATSVDIKFLNNFQDKLFVAHNAKIDYQILRVNNVTLPRWYDTMIVEQRLGGGYARYNNLEATYERRLKRYMPEDKATRNEFTKSKLSMVFKTKHIDYTIGDIEGLLEIKEAQKPLIEYWKMEFLIYEIEFPLITILGRAEIEGFKLDETKWREIINDNVKRLFEIEKELDSILLNIPCLPIELRTGKFQRSRNKAEAEQLDMFGESKKVVNSNKGNINYSSSKQILNIFRIAGEPIPWITNPKDRSSTNASVKEEALQRYLIDYPETLFKDFINKLLDYKETEKELNSFGERFVNYYITKKNSKVRVRGYKHPKTDRVHTIFKQCFTSTNRLASGDADIGLYNCQQVPARKVKIGDDWKAIFRECFIGENGNYVTTADLSGAELIIMCALAKDFHLYELGIKNDDLHSPLATKSWRAVFLYRAGKELNLWNNPEEYEKRKTDKELLKLIKEEEPELYHLYETFEVTKKNKIKLDSSKVDVRTDFKSMGFGVIYGMYDKKGGETLNIPKDEAKVIINVIKEELITTIKMVEKASEDALRDGYVVHNTRTNSLRRFDKVDRANEHGEELAFMDKVNVGSEARNTRIQGTQADMIKESMVEIQKYIDKHNEPAWLRLNVHDELVYEHKNKEFGKVIADTMVEVANRYLIEGIEMKVEYDTLHSWTK